jgi:heme oxygenase (biliverdin-IX-beta and delta-forming)
MRFVAERARNAAVRCLEFFYPIARSAGLGCSQFASRRSLRWLLGIFYKSRIIAELARGFEVHKPVSLGSDAALALSKANAMRRRLRDATAAAHERMHAHAGFKGAAAGTIEPLDYRLLLIRLYGFHKPFEDLVRATADRVRLDLDMVDRARSPLLLADLQALGFDTNVEAGLPLWRPSVHLASKGALLGALYVLEGSTLGGVQIARALKDRGSGDVSNARLFFLGRGERQGAMWRELLQKLGALRDDDHEATEAEEAAVATFGAFEDWMSRWRG